MVSFYSLRECVVENKSCGGWECNRKTLSRKQTHTLVPPELDWLVIPYFFFFFLVIPFRYFFFFFFKIFVQFCAVVKQENNGSEGTVLQGGHSPALWLCKGSIKLLEFCCEKDAMVGGKKSLGNGLKLSMIFESNFLEIFMRFYAWGWKNNYFAIISGCREKWQKCWQQN